MKDAPARISMIMQVTRVAPITLAQNALPREHAAHHAMPSEPSTPQAAHSVAVAQPISSDRNTSTISSHQRNELARTRAASRGTASAAQRGGTVRGCSERPDHDVAGVERHHEQAGQEAGEKDLDDRDVGRHRIDHHGDRRRNQDAERARAGERAERSPSRRSRASSAPAARSWRWSRRSRPTSPTPSRRCRRRAR